MGNRCPETLRTRNTIPALVITDVPITQARTSSRDDRRIRRQKSLARVCNSWQHTLQQRATGVKIEGIPSRAEWNRTEMQGPTRPEP